MAALAAALTEWSIASVAIPFGHGLGSGGAAFGSAADGGRHPLRGAWVRALTDALACVWRADVSNRAEVVAAERQKWPHLPQSWAASGDIEVITNDAYYFYDCARLRSELGLERRQPWTLDRYLDKVKMKTALDAACVRVPAWVAFDVVPDVDGIELMTRTGHASARVRWVAERSCLGRRVENQASASTLK